MGRYVSEAWFGRQLARHPPAHRRVANGPARSLAGPAPLLRHDQPEPARQARPEVTRPGGMALITAGTVLLLAVSVPLPFLSVKILGLIMIVAGLVKARALQRVSSRLWQNRKVIAARVPLHSPLEAGAPVARPAGFRAGADQLADGRFTVTVIVPAHAPSMSKRPGNAACSTVMRIPPEASVTGSGESARGLPPSSA